MFMQSTIQFQQATQSTLQANIQAIVKLEIQMAQLTSLSERERNVPSQLSHNQISDFKAKLKLWMNLMAKWNKYKHWLLLEVEES